MNISKESLSGGVRPEWEWTEDDHLMCDICGGTDFRHAKTSGSTLTWNCKGCTRRFSYIFAPNRRERRAMRRFS